MAKLYGQWAGRMAFIGISFSALSCTLETDSGHELVGPEDGVVQEDSLGAVQQAACGGDNCCPSEYTRCFLHAPVSSFGVPAKAKIKYYECGVSAASLNPAKSCPVELGWYIIGGGGQILDANGGTSTSPGTAARITSSLPNGDLDGGTNMPYGWHIQSRGTVAHRVSAFAIAMKLEDYSPLSIGGTNPFEYNQVNSQASTRPQGSVQVPSDDVLVGGGFASLDPEQPIHIVDSYASAMLNGTWFVNGSNLQVNGGPTGRLKAMAISLPRCPGRWSRCFTDRKFQEAVSTTGTGPQSAFAVNTSPDYIATGVGVMSSSWYRPLAGWFPLAHQQVQWGGGVAKTHGNDASGYVTAQALMLKIPF